MFIINFANDWIRTMDMEATALPTEPLPNLFNFSYLLMGRRTFLRRMTANSHLVEFYFCDFHFMPQAALISRLSKLSNGGWTEAILLLAKKKIFTIFFDVIHLDTLCLLTYLLTWISCTFHVGKRCSVIVTDLTHTFFASKKKINRYDCVPWKLSP